MGFGFLHGNGGSGNFILNDNIITYASDAELPLIAEDNTIAVCTNVPISKYTFSNTRPDSELDDGYVWFKTGYNQYNYCSLSNNHRIMVYPEYVEQYVNGEWVDRVAKTYRNGVWVDWWNGTLFMPNYYDSLATGGWGITPKRPGSETPSYAVNVAPTIGKDSIYVNLLDSQMSTVLHTRNKIDLTKFSTLTFEGAFARRSANLWDLFAACWPDLASCDYYVQNFAVHAVIPTNQVNSIVIDVSALEGEYNIGIGICNGAVSITKCYLS